MVNPQVVGVVHEHLGSVMLRLTIRLVFSGYYWCDLVLDGQDGQEINANYGGRDLEALLDRCARLVEVFS